MKSKIFLISLFFNLIFFNFISNAVKFDTSDLERIEIDIKKIKIDIVDFSNKIQKINDKLNCLKLNIDSSLKTKFCKLYFISFLSCNQLADQSSFDDLFEELIKSIQQELKCYILNFSVLFSMSRNNKNILPLLAKSIKKFNVYKVSLELFLDKF